MAHCLPAPGRFPCCRRNGENKWQYVLGIKPTCRRRHRQHLCGGVDLTVGSFTYPRWIRTIKPRYGAGGVPGRGGGRVATIDQRNGQEDRVPAGGRAHVRQARGAPLKVPRHNCLTARRERRSRPLCSGEIPTYNFAPTRLLFPLYRRRVRARPAARKRRHGIRREGG